MTLPLWALVGFATWTLGLVVAGVGAYRVAQVLLGRARPNAFPADTPHGPDWYRRLMRAHANCVENLPIFAVLVVVGHLVGLRDGTFATLALTTLGARVGQTAAHLSSGRSLVVNIRFAFFVVQLVCFGAMIVQIVRA